MWCVALANIVNYHTKGYQQYRFCRRTISCNSHLGRWRWGCFKWPNRPRKRADAAGLTFRHDLQKNRVQICARIGHKSDLWTNYLCLWSKLNACRDFVNALMAMTIGPKSDHRWIRARGHPWSIIVCPWAAPKSPRSHSRASHMRGHPKASYYNGYQVARTILLR